MWPNPQEIADLVTFTEWIFNGKLQFLCSDRQTSNRAFCQIILVKSFILSVWQGLEYTMQVDICLSVDSPYTV